MYKNTQSKAAIEKKLNKILAEAKTLAAKYGPGFVEETHSEIDPNEEEQGEMGRHVNSDSKIDRTIKELQETYNEMNGEEDQPYIKNPNETDTDELAPFDENPTKMDTELGDQGETDIRGTKKVEAIETTKKITTESLKRFTLKNGTFYNEQDMLRRIPKKAKKSNFVFEIADKAGEVYKIQWNGNENGKAFILEHKNTIVEAKNRNSFKLLTEYAPNVTIKSKVLIDESSTFSKMFNSLRNQRDL